MWGFLVCVDLEFGDIGSVGMSGGGVYEVVGWGMLLVGFGFL